jgi:hypothetical protein
LNEFVSTGKHEDFKADPKPTKKAEAAPLEVEKPKPVVDPGEREKEPEAPAEDTADDEDTKAAVAQNEKLRDAILRKNTVINRKHREMRQAREAAEEADRLAESQFNRARLAEDALTATQRELAELKAKAAPAAKTEESKKPDAKNYYDDKGQFKAFEYAEDLAAFSAEKAVRTDREKQLADARAREAAAAEEVAKTRVAKSREKYADFDRVMTADETQLSQPVLAYLSTSEYIGDVSYYIATHKDFAEKISKLNPLKAIAEIGKLELSFEPKKTDTAVTETVTDPAKLAAVTKVSGAPAPIKTLNTQGSANINTDPAKMSFQELRAYERSRAKKR